jgi:protein gp37
MGKKGDVLSAREVEQLVARHTAEIKALIGRNTLNVLAIGEKLLAVKQELKHGPFLTWLEREFDWSVSLADKMMAVAKRFKFVNFTNLPIEPSALYVLAEKKTPEAVVEQALALARKGETITHAKAKVFLKDYRDWEGERVEASAPDVGADEEDADDGGIDGEAVVAEEAEAGPELAVPEAPAPTEEEPADLDDEPMGLVCETCGAPLSNSAWHCQGCGEHWALTREACGSCGQARPFDYFPPPPGAEVWDPFQEVPEGVTFIREVPDHSDRAETEQQSLAQTSKPTIEAPALILTAQAVTADGKRPVFNQTNTMVDWAKWTWNPVTGCLHDCEYCYARVMAQTLYPEKFTPTFRPDRLKAPHFTKVPRKAEDMSLPKIERIGWRNVFVCSMADLFGKWVPQEWIDAVLDEVRAAPQWNFLFLTKFPQRLASIDWPDNAWVGTTVDRQYRVSIAEKAFRQVKAPVKWLSCEPLLEDLTFTSLEMFDWVVFGGQSPQRSETQGVQDVPGFQPPWPWVEHLFHQARAAGCLVYFKPNLETRPQEYPQQKEPG